MKMEESLKHRILGTSIFVIFLSFIVPLVLDGNDQDEYLERTLVKSDQIENSSRRVVEIYLNDEEFELNSQSSENLNFFSQIKSKFNTIERDTVTDEIALEVNESVKEIKQIKEKETQAPIENEFWTVQLGSYRDLSNAKGEIVSLRDLNFNAYIKEDKVGDVSEYKVRVGSELTRNMAEEISSNLKMNNYENQLVPYN
jgi:cell division septation protein DedD